MKYEKLMKERGINLIDLPKATQNKIESLNVLLDDLNRLKSIPDEDIEEEDIEEIKEIEKEIEDLDTHLERKIELFDPAKQAKLIEKVKIMAELKKQKGRPKKPVEEVKEEEAPEVSEEKVADESKLEALAYISKMIPVQEKVQENVQNDVHEEPTQHKLNVEKVEEEEEIEDEDEEFQKMGEAKPKKVMNKGWILMGVGFLFLTWGAVNVFKEKRG